MDCAWGFVCQDGQPLVHQPLFHLRTQDDLHRLGGWAQFASGGVQGHHLLFALLASHYGPSDPESMPWNVQAFSDFRIALTVVGYRDVERVPRLAPKGAVANQSLQVLHSPTMTVLAMSCWTGSIEIEGTAIFHPNSVALRRVALHHLIAQMRAAVIAAS
jgi:hypothetical protein